MDARVKPAHDEEGYAVITELVLVIPTSPAMTVETPDWRLSQSAGQIALLGIAGES